MQDNFAEQFIQGHALGTAQRRKKEEFDAQQEEQKWHREMQKAELKRQELKDKLQERMMANEDAQQRIKLMTGQPGTTPAGTVMSLPDQGAGPGMTASQSMATVPSPDSYAQGPTVNVPSLMEGQPGTMVKVLTDWQMQQQKRAYEEDAARAKALYEPPTVVPATSAGYVPRGSNTLIPIPPELAKSATEKTSTPTPWMDAYKLKYGKFPDDEQITAHDVKLRQAGGALFMGGAGDEDAINMAAEVYNQTTQLPGGLTRDPNFTKKVLERAAKINKAAGGGSPAENKAEFEANKESLKAAQKSRDAIASFEETATKNLKLMQYYAKRLTDSGSPYINSLVRAWENKAVGDTNLSGFNAARRVFATEAGKLTSGSSTLSGTLTVSDKKEIDDIISGNATIPQLLEIANVLTKDFTNRKTSQDHIIQDIQGRMKIGGAASAPAAANKYGPVIERTLKSGGKVRVKEVLSEPGKFVPESTQ